MKTILCKKCKIQIVDGNGYICDSPPWEENGQKSGYCFECENRDLEEAERQHTSQLIKAVCRSGRFDCL